jgi:DHA1 family bicyclomycin/chloramphenicol resistance-like MFS transporter
MTRSTLLRLTLILGALTAFAPMSIDMYLPGLPTLGREFHAEPGTVELTLTAFFVALALSQVLYGPFADRFGRKAPLYVGLILYVVASVACALAPDIYTLIGMRFLQASGGCAGIVIARAVVRDLFQSREAARMFSLMMLVMGSAPILAPIVGGYLLVWLGWRSIFWVLAGFGACGLIGVAAWLPETRPRSARTSDGAIGAAAAYARLLRTRAFVGYALAGGFAQAGMFAYIAGSPSVFIDFFGLSAPAYGWLFGANALGLIASSQINRRLLAHGSAARILSRANTINACAGLVLAVVAATRPDGLTAIVLPLFCYLASLGFIFPNSAALALAEHGKRAGVASALFGTLAYSAATISSMLVARLHNGGPVPMAVVIAGCGVLAWCAGRFIVPAGTAPRVSVAEPVDIE